MKESKRLFVFSCVIPGLQDLYAIRFVYVNRFHRQRVQFLPAVQDLRQESGYLLQRSAGSTASNMYIENCVMCDNPKLATSHADASEWSASFIMSTWRVFFVRGVSCDLFWCVQVSTRTCVQESPRGWDQLYGLGATRILEYSLDSF